MGRSAKFGRVGKTKKERDQIKVTMNSRITKPTTPSAKSNRKTPSEPTQSPAVAAAAAALKAVANPRPAAKKTKEVPPPAPPAKASTTAEVEMGDATSAAVPDKSYILKGRVDYVSLMNSRRSAKTLKEVKDLRK
ncbi:hypothetical protein DFJ77DRAFT_477310 [Powellomyces hirtus]|nr:hypothetical protein DFJ77DRAFT_477310 [Powellomyces hirtus]